MTRPPPVKWDGYRLCVVINYGKATVRTRRGHDWTYRFRPITDAAAELLCRNAVLDGEAVILDAHGRADFAALQDTATANRAIRRLKGCEKILRQSRSHESAAKRIGDQMPSMVSGVHRSTPRSLYVLLLAIAVLKLDASASGTIAPGLFLMASAIRNAMS